MAFRNYDYSKHKPQLGLKAHSSSDCRETFEDLCTEGECLRLNDSRVLDDSDLDNSRTDIFVNAKADGLLLEGSYKNQPLSEEQLILLPCGVPGFSLRSRAWGSIHPWPCQANADVLVQSCSISSISLISRIPIGQMISTRPSTISSSPMNTRRQ